jgi:RHS repeat-associated protein
MVQPNTHRAFDFGNGADVTGLYQANYYPAQFPDSGTFNVTMTIGDNSGVKYTVTKPITVLNLPPSVTVEAGKIVLWGEPWTNAPHLSDPSPVDSQSLHAVWNFGDGQTSACVNCTDASSRVTHAYALPGVYAATLTVTDKDGGEASAIATYTVKKRPTSLTFITTQLQPDGQHYLVRARLDDPYGGLALPNKPVQFSLNGVTANSITNANGIAAATFAFAPNAPVGLATATFSEDDMYESCGGAYTPPPSPDFHPSGTRSSRGTDFWLMFPQNYIDGFGLYDISLFITADEDTSGVVTVARGSFPFTVPAHGVAKVPLTFAEVDFESDTIVDKGIHVSSLKPVSVYGLNHRSFTSDAYLGLPTNALGTDYITLGYANGQNIQGSEFGIVASQDGTTVTITPSVTTGARTANVPYQISLNQRQVYMLTNLTPGKVNDLSRSIVTADKPIAVISGHLAATIPDNSLFADHLVEQLPSTDTWGKHFVTMPMASRLAGDTFRILASVDNTHVYVNGARIATLNRAEFFEKIFKEASYIVSDQPILVAQYSNGTILLPGLISFDPTLGDPSMMLIPPYEQFLESYTFVTLDIFGFDNHHVNVVAPTTAIGSITLDGATIPVSSFVPISSSGFSGAQLSLSPGTHNLAGSQPFGAHVYGFGQDVGYAYPGGMNLVSNLNSAVLTLNPKTSTRPVGAPRCESALLTDQYGVPLGNQTISFTVSGVNNHPAQPAITDATGQTQFCYTGTNIGSDVVLATAGSASDTAAVEWVTTVPNQAPVVNAGADQAINLPAPALLIGSVTDDGLPSNTVNVSWAKFSGPGNVAFSDPAATVTSVTFDAAGVYVLRLTASDTDLSTSDDVQITVNPTPTNQAPTANAGSDQSVSMKGNLIVNGGNDEPLVNGEIPGWTEVGGSAWTKGNSSIAGLPDPYVGNSFFYVGDGTSNAELRQDIDVSAFAANIAAGTQQFELQAYLRELQEFSTIDQPRVVLEYRNAQNNGIIGVLDSNSVYSPSSWAGTESIHTVPVGTGWIRVRLLAKLNIGATNDGYFDSISLRPVDNAAIKLNGAVTDDGLPYGSTLTAHWDLVSGPAAVTFTNVDSAGSPALFTAPGTYVLKLTASDGQASTDDDVTITVFPANQPPTVNSGTNQTITLPGNATLDAIISDDGLPQGSRLSYVWKKEQGPGMVTFANANAASTTASFSTPGFYILDFAVDDSEYTAATVFYVNVNPAATNQAPMVSAGPDQTISSPTDTATLNGSAADDGLPAGNSLSVLWTTVSGPGVVNFGTPNAAVTTAQFSAAGTYVLRLTASDGELSTSDDVNVTLTAANQPPTVNAGADQTTILSAGVQLNGSVSDDGLPAGNTLTTTWSAVSGPGTVTFGNIHAIITGVTFSATGTYVLRVTASDGELTTSDDVTITVNDDVPPPTVQITAPSDDASVTEPTSVTGSVSGGAWTLEYSLDSNDDQNSRVWTTFASGNGAASGLLGTLDPTMMLNGLFDIRLSATDGYGQISRTKVSVIVERNLKVGNFTVSFTDLSIPVAGVPMEVTRTYDSRDKRVGDFGFGWTLGLHNIRVEKSSVLGLKWYETVSQEVFPNYCLEPVGSHTVTVTFPGGKVFKFQPSVEPHCQRTVPITTANISFTPMSGTVGRLEVIGSSDVQIDGSVPGPVNLIGFGGGVDIFNSFVFKFTAEDGTAYIIDQRTGLQSLADPNGNTLTIGAGGIVHSSGKSIVFNRDSFGRINSITDPNGNSQFYNYDANGDLVSYTDNENNTSTYSYDSNHRLLTIHDPRGIQPIRNDYDPDGRLISHTDGFGKVITYLHDIPSRTETVTDRLGHPTVFEYDERGNVLRKTDARGGVTSFTYDANDNVLTETNALGKTTTYSYDNNNHRTSITDSLGNLTQATYNDLGRVLTITDPLGHVITNTYNSAGNQITAEDSLHHVTSYTYSVFDGQLTTMTDALNNATHYEYTAGNLTKKTDALGNETTFTFDANSNRTSQTVTRTNPLGQVETIATVYEYDKLNRLDKTTFADGSFVRVEYNSIGQRIATVDQLNHRTDFNYDDMGRLTRSTHPDGTHEDTTYDAEGRKLTTTDRAGHVTSYTYDEVGRVKRKTLADGRFTLTSYDNVGEVLSTADARGNLTHYFYDDAGRRTSVRNALNQETTFDYDRNGQELSRTDALGHITSYEYDLNGRRTKTTYADSTFESVGYDALGRRVSATDQAGKTTQFSYDAMGRLTKVSDALGQETNYAFDELGQQISQTDANHHSTRFEYDQLGRPVKRTQPGGQVESYTYDVGGNLASKTDFNGETTTFSYDAMRRLLSKTPDASLNQPVVSFTYHATGERASMADASGTTLYTYDARNRLTTKQTPFGTLSYSYDGGGNLLTTRSSTANGISVDYSYDALNRLATVKDNNLLTLNAGVTAYTYDLVGNLQSYQYPNGVTTSYAHNSVNRLTTMTVSTQLSSLAGYSYTLGPAGNRTSVTELGGRTVNFTYDDLYRLTGEFISNDPHSANGNISYGYDPVGNRLDRSSSIASAPSQSSSYDSNDHLASDTYDNNGNTTASNGNAYGYDFESHLTSLNNGSVNYVYDGDGNRTGKTAAGVTINYLIDTNNPTGYAQVVEELQGSSVVKQFTYGHDLISQRIVGGGLSFYEFDGQGSVRLLTNAAAATTDVYDYDAFGNLIYHSGTTPNDYLFCGQQFDAALGLYYLRARFMNPESGRFWTMDAADGDRFETASLHKYLYANANPVNNQDPSGYFSISEVLTSFGVEGVLNNISCLMIKGALWGAAYGAGEAYFKGEDVVEGTIKGAVWGALLGPLGALKFLQPFLVSAGLALGAKSVYDAYRDENYGLALFRGVFFVASAREVLTSGIPSEATGDVGVYRSVNPDTGEVQYVGITKDFEARAAAHFREKGIEIEEIDGLQNLSREDARGVEQVLIDYYGLGKNKGTLLNKINSIAETNPIYADSLRRGNDLLEEAGYPWDGR